jgi:two-component system, response regulator YesN
MLLRLFLKVANTFESISGRTDYASIENAPESFDPVSVLETFNTLDEAREWLKKLYTDTYCYVTGIKSRTGQLYLKIKAYIEKNYGESELNLKKCSEDLFLSPSYIGMILKKETGRTFVDYLNEYRIKKASELLSKPENKVYEVSILVGFTHPTYFSSVFKKLVGISPKQFKEKA